MSDFALAVISNCPTFLDGEYSIAVLAQKLNLPPEYLGKAIHHPLFRREITALIAAQEFNFAQESAHVKLITGRATSAKSNTKDAISAARYLRELQRNQTESPGDNRAIVPIQINIGTTRDEPALTIDMGEPSFQPAKAGGLPPSAVRRRTSKTDEKGAEKIHGVRVGSDLDFYTGREEDKVSPEPAGLSGSARI